jgi:hypothetical protein
VRGVPDFESVAVFDSSVEIDSYRACGNSGNFGIGQFVWIPHKFTNHRTWPDIGRADIRYAEAN